MAKNKYVNFTHKKKVDVIYIAPPYNTNILHDKRITI